MSNYYLSPPFQFPCYHEMARPQHTMLGSKLYGSKQLRTADKGQFSTTEIRWQDSSLALSKKGVSKSNSYWLKPFLTDTKNNKCCIIKHT